MTFLVFLAPDILTQVPKGVGLRTQNVCDEVQMTTTITLAPQCLLEEGCCSEELAEIIRTTTTTTPLVFLVLDAWTPDPKDMGQVQDGRGQP